MKCKNICLCIKGRTRKGKENEVEDSEKLSDDKGKTKGGGASTTPAGDDGVGGNAHGASTTASNDAGGAAAVVTASHVSVMSANEGGDGSAHRHGHGGESGGDGGG